MPGPTGFCRTSRPLLFITVSITVKASAVKKEKITTTTTECGKDKRTIKNSSETLDLGSQTYNITLSAGDGGNYVASVNDVNNYNQGYDAFTRGVEQNCSNNTKTETTTVGPFDVECKPGKPGTPAGPNNCPPAVDAIPPEMGITQTVTTTETNYSPKFKVSVKSTPGSRCILG